MNTTANDLRAAVDNLTPDQIEQIKAGLLLVPPAIAAIVAERQGPVPVIVPPPPPKGRPDHAAWMASQDAYDDARAKAESMGASPANLNALMSPSSTALRCGLDMLPMTLSAYVFLEAVNSPFVTGDGQPTPSDLLFLAAALTAPEDAAAVVTFDDDFAPSANPEALKAVADRIGLRVTAADVPRLIAHATAQMRLMFPPVTSKESESGDPLTRPAEAPAG